VASFHPPKNLTPEIFPPKDQENVRKKKPKNVSKWATKNLNIETLKHRTNFARNEKPLT